MGADVVIAPGRRLFIEYHLDASAFGGEFDGISQKIQKNLVQTETVAAYIFHGNILDIHVKILLLFPDLRLHNINNPLHNIFQGNLFNVQDHLSALDLGHIQDIVDQPQKMPAGGGNLL